MNTFVLLITLLTPAGDVALITDHFPDRAAGEVGRKEAIIQVQRKPKGFSIKDSACYPMMKGAKK